MSTLFALAARLQAAGAAEAMLLIVVKATLILAIARLMIAAVPRASAAMKHAIATAALIGVGVLPILSLVVPAWELAVVKREMSAPPTAAAAAPESAAAPHLIGVRDDVETTSPTLAVAKAIAPEPLSAIERATEVAGATWKGMIVVAIGLAALLMIVHILFGMFGVWFVTRKAEELQRDDALLALDDARDQLALGTDVRLLRSSRISVPVLWGVTKPVLLLPPDVVTWPIERLRVVLLHELAHLKRYDGVSLILTRIAVSLFWFHPLAWSLERAGRSECERACDDLVLAGGTKPSEYADHLLAIARSMPSFDPFRSVTLAMSRKSQLEGRLLSILQRDVARRVFSGRAVAFACALAVAVIAPVAAVRLIAEPAKPQPKPAGTAGTAITVSADEVEENIHKLGDFFLTKMGKYDKRADKFTKTPKSAEQWYDRAYDLYRAERFEEAAAAFRRAAEEGHRPETALYNAACSYALLGDAGRASEALAAAIDAGWDDIEKIAEDSDFDPIRSDPRFARAVKDHSGDVVTRRVHETVERYTDLRNNPRRASHHDDDWYEVGLDLLRLRKFDESIHAFEQSIAAGEKEAAAMYNIACAYSLRGDARNGMAWLEKAVDTGYGSEEKFRNDPDIALLRKQPGFEALVVKAEDLELRGWGSNDFDGWKVWKLGNWKESAQHHRAIAAKFPNSGRAWANLGYTALQARDFATAHEAYRKAIALNHRVGTASYNIACAYALQGDTDAAFEWLGRAKAANFDLEDHVYDDDDLDSLHDDPRWETLTAGLPKHKKHRW
jgi:beta-lactamase regulating signal transducer with metallopeptidase domain/Flp pilus assembly protein TadD